MSPRRRAFIYQALTLLAVVCLVCGPFGVRILTLGLAVYFGPRLKRWVVAAATAQLQANIAAQLQHERASAVADEQARESAFQRAWATPSWVPPRPAAPDPSPGGVDPSVMMGLLYAAQNAMGGALPPSTAVDERAEQLAADADLGPRLGEGTPYDWPSEPFIG